MTHADAPIPIAVDGIVERSRPPRASILRPQARVIAAASARLAAADPDSPAPSPKPAAALGSGTSNPDSGAGAVPVLVAAPASAPVRDAAGHRTRPAR